MWDQAYVSTKQYMCLIAQYLMYFLSKSCQIVLDGSVDTPGHGKDVVDGFNDVQKLYLATCLRMCSTPEVDKIVSQCMRVHDITEKGKLSFAKESKLLLKHHDEIGTQGDNKHEKREAKA